MRKERKILRVVPQKLRKSFANGNPICIGYIQTNKQTSKVLYRSHILKISQIMESNHNNYKLFEETEDSMDNFLIHVNLIKLKFFRLFELILILHPPPSMTS